MGPEDFDIYPSAVDTWPALGRLVHEALTSEVPFLTDLDAVGLDPDIYLWEWQLDMDMFLGFVKVKLCSR